MLTASVRCSAALAAATLASFSSLRADTPTRSRAVIRGTGSDVTIVYQASKSEATAVRASLAEDPVAEALRRKTNGEDDAAIIDFLRIHHASLPELIDSEVVKDFRRAGAGQPVISVLLAFAAADIGETAEGAPVQQLPASSEVPYGVSYPDLVDMGYPFFSGYGGGYFAGGDFGRRRKGKHFGRHGSHRGFGFSFGKRFSPKGHAPKARPTTPHGRRGASRPHGFR
jgi:hypothetical protein